MHVFSPRIFDSLEYLIQNNIREKNEIQLTAAQEYLRQHSDKYWCVVSQGQRYDTGIPYGLMETQLALALNGIHRTEILRSHRKDFGDAGEELMASALPPSISVTCWIPEFCVCFRRICLRPIRYTNQTSSRY